MQNRKSINFYKNKTKASNLFRFLIAIIYPERCPYCGKVIEPLEIACDECCSSLPKTAFERYAAGGFFTVSALPYSDKYKKALIDFKFHKSKSAAPQFAVVMDAAAKKYLSNADFDLISYVPLHPLRLKERGYNQSKLLAKELSRLMCIPCEDTLIKIKNNPPQHETEFKRKRENVRGIYKVLDAESIRGKRILLIDDIITSGHTLGECAAMLSGAGAESVTCLTLATAVTKMT